MRRKQQNPYNLEYDSNTEHNKLSKITPVESNPGKKYLKRFIWKIFTYKLLLKHLKNPHQRL